MLATIVIITAIAHLIWIILILRANRGPNPYPDDISTVCMDCQAHLSGPLPTRTAKISHSICKRCAESRIRETIAIRNTLRSYQSYRSYRSLPSSN